MVANVAGTLLAYHDRCAGCAAPLSHGRLVGGTLTCTGCDRSFDLPRAGRCRDDGTLQLAPVPLLRNGGRVRVALTP
jgi:nitrite reductase/ring-hydroxylating ferredoxin subunit